MLPPTRLRLAPYRDQCARWPSTGRHVLAQYDDWTVVVYQAYRRAIGDFAASHGWFGGGFLLDRMSWIKPGFLRLVAIVCGWFMLRGANWARWALLAWFAYHVVLSALHTPFELAVHAALLLAIAYLLLRPEASAYFRGTRGSPRADAGPDATSSGGAG